MNGHRLLLTREDTLETLLLLVREFLTSGVDLLWIGVYHLYQVLLPLAVLLVIGGV